MPGVVVLSPKNSSSFTVNPPIEEAAGLTFLKYKAIDYINFINVYTKLRFDSIGRLQLDVLLKYKTDISRDAVDQGSKKTHTVADHENQTANGDYWIRGFLNFADEDQKCII